MCKNENALKRNIFKCMFMTLFDGLLYMAKSTLAMELVKFRYVQVYSGDIFFNCVS